MKSYSSREVLKILKADGWVEIAWALNESPHIRLSIASLCHKLFWCFPTCCLKFGNVCGFECAKNFSIFGRTEYSDRWIEDG